MSLLRHLRAGIRRLTNRHVVDRELDDEMRAWIDMATRDYVARGLSPDAAARQARLDVGSVAATRDHVRDAGWDGAVDSVLRDVHYALRSLRLAPGYAALAIVTLGTGIALTTSVLTVSNAVLRQQWNVADPAHVVQIVNTRGITVVSPAEARYLGAHSTAIAGLAVVRCIGGIHENCQVRLDAGTAEADLVSGNYFSLLGIPLQAGRGFLAEDDRLDAPRAVVVLSDAAWRSRFGADSSIVGTQIRIDEVPFTVVGIANREFTGTRTERKDLWMPLSSMLLLRPGRPEIRAQLTDPAHSEAVVAARLANGVSVERARAELAALNKQYRADRGLDDMGLRLIPSTLFPNPAKLRVARGTFAAMLTAVLLVLLLACANVGNLLLARATARRHEIAIRLALGASRRRVLRQMLTESFLLAAAGGLLGVGIAVRVPAMVMTRAMGEVSWRFVPDMAVIGAALGLVVVTCIAFGLAPALHATRAEVAASLKAGERGTGQSRAALRNAMLAIQIAVSLLLLVNAGTLVRGIQHSRNRELGFTARGVNVMTFELPASYEPSRVAAFAQQLTADAGAMSGLTMAFASRAPLAGEEIARFRLPGDPPSKERNFAVVRVSASYFSVLGMRIVAGRNLESADGDDAVIVNQSLAKTLWPDDNPLGKTLIDGAERRVVGVVNDASMRHFDQMDPTMFRPIATDRSPVLLVRGASPAITKSLTAMAERIDPRVRPQVDSIMGGLDRQLGGFRVVAMLAGALGIIALVLAAVGVFGVFSYIVQQRTREIGIRTALGASTGRVVGLVFRDNGRATATGIGVGFAGGYVVSRLLGSELFGLASFDMTVFASAAVLLVVAAAAATWAPARRAARIDPLIALRQD